MFPLEQQTILVSGSTDGFETVGRTVDGLQHDVEATLRLVSDPRASVWPEVGQRSRGAEAH
jgi:hypothetical protein